MLDRNPNYREVLYNETPPTDDPGWPPRWPPCRASACPDVDQVQIEITEEPQPAGSALRAARPTSSSTCRPSSPASPCRATSWRPTSPNAASAWSGTTGPTSRSPTSTWKTRWWAATRQRRWRCAAPSTWPWTWTLRSAPAPPRQAMKAQGVVPLTSFGPPGLQDREMGEYNPPKAKALLDLYGYTDKDGDGWRDQPDGKPWSPYNTEPNAEQRAGRAVAEEHGCARHPHPVRLGPSGPRTSRPPPPANCRCGAWWSAAIDDGDTFLALGPARAGRPTSALQPPGLSRCTTSKNPARRPRAPGRDAGGAEAAVAYAPYKFHVHRIWTDMAPALGQGLPPQRSTVYVKDWQVRGHR